MIALDNSPAMIALVRLPEFPGIVVGSITATKTIPAAKGSTRPVTGEVLSIVITKAMIKPMRNTSVNCDKTRSIKFVFPVG